MLKLNKFFRTTYSGEDIVVERNYTNGIWQDTTERVPNSITNTHISNQAVVIGNGPSRLEFPLQPIAEHTGGLLGADTLQSYGCNALYRDFTPHFLVAKGAPIIKTLASSDYVKTNIVYASSIHLLEHPNKFYLIPRDPYTDAGTTAAYLAAFDGHKKIFLLGFDNQDSANFNYNVYADTEHYDSLRTTVSDLKWVADRATLFSTYDDVDFVWVTKLGKTTVPTSWKYCSNFRQVSFRQFVLEANL